MTTARGAPVRPVAGRRRAGPNRAVLLGAGVVVALLTVVVLVSAGVRLAEDVPHVLAGTMPDTTYAARFVEHPVTAYLHLVPGVLYLLGAPLQLARRVRRRSYPLHRRLGRALLGAGLVSGIFALAFGLPHSFGGGWQAAATAVFGVWFLACLVLAFRAIRRRDVVAHRRWMVRAFVTGLAVGTIRLWIGLFQATGLLDFRDSFAPAFWLAFSLHAAVGEVWLRATPHPRG